MNIKEKLKTIGTIILLIYGLSVLLFGTYFEWQFAVENGFIEWLLLGWLIPALKAIIWPVFVLF